MRLTAIISSECVVMWQMQKTAEGNDLRVFDYDTEKVLNQYCLKKPLPCRGNAIDYNDLASPMGADEKLYQRRIVAAGEDLKWLGNKKPNRCFRQIPYITSLEKCSI